MRFELTDDAMRVTAVLYKNTQTAEAPVVSPDVKGTPVSSEFRAGEILSGHRMVTLNASSKAVYASHDNPDHASRIVGMTTNAAIMDGPVNIVSAGPVVDSSWLWDMNPARSRVFMLLNGLISQTPPVSGYLCPVGFVINANTIFVSIQSPTRIL
ncbi:MAG: hypothetical protein H7838_11405 [Magnetococcus sp. DMHC-8]